MPNYTIDDYKKAIKDKFEIEKGGEYSNHFNPPSEVNLKNLCIKRFSSNPTREDLEVFFSFFGFAFDATKKNLFKDDLSKFKPVRSFLLNKTTSPKDETIHFSAILVDFRPRPLNNFILEWNGSEKQADDKKSEKVENPECDKKRNAEDENKVNSLFNIKESVLNRLRKNIKKTAIGVAIILALGFGVIYYAFWNKGCMQWNNDHYDIVDCSLKEEDNTIVILDPTIVNLKKIKVCDTTVFFKHGKAGVFYAKSASSVEYFNQMAPHPETGKYLKPITNYMIYKYVGPCK